METRQKDEPVKQVPLIQHSQTRQAPPPETRTAPPPYVPPPDRQTKASGDEPELNIDFLRALARLVDPLERHRQTQEWAAASGGGKNGSDDPPPPIDEGSDDGSDSSSDS